MPQRYNLQSSLGPQAFGASILELSNEWQEWSMQKPAVAPLAPIPVRGMEAVHMPELDQTSASRCRNPDCSERTMFNCCTWNIFLNSQLLETVSRTLIKIKETNE